MLAAAALLSVSCQKAFNEGGSSPDGTAKVSVDLSFPTIQTRAYSDGTTAKQLQYAVYMKDNAGKLQLLSGFTKTTEEINLKKEVSFQLVTGHTYGFVFWAANASAPYSVVFGPEGATMTIDDKKLVANAETLDAFYAYKEIEVKGDVGMQVQLRRPFAQINVGTNDYDAAKAAGYVPTESHIQLSSVYTTLDLVNGNVGGEKTDLAFAYASIPASEKFPVESTKYKYMAMVYALVGADEPVVEVSFDCKDAKGEVRAIHTVGSVPVKRNHRTNIYGQLLTSNAKVIVEIVPAYDEPDYVLEYIADGVEYDAVSQTFSISSEAGLRWVADQVNSHGADAHVKAESFTYGAAYVAFVGQKVVLTKDIDLNNVSWTPIGCETKENGASIYAFAGTFDGANKTISNLTIKTEQNSNAGLFGATNRATIKDLTIKNVKIESHYKTGAIVGDGYNARIENCHVEGGTITVTPWEIKPGVYDDANNVGGIVGYLNGQPEEAYAKGCSVKGLEITAFRKVGGIAGVATTADDANPHTSSVEISGCTVESTTITADMTEMRYDGFLSRQPEAGTIFGSKSNTGRETLPSDNSTETQGSVTIVVKEVKKASATEAKKEITAGGDVYLTEDVTYPSSYATLTIDKTNLNLGGHTLTAPGGGSYKDAVVVGNGAEVSITNGTLLPPTDALADGSSATLVLMTAGGGKLTLEDVNVIGNVYPVELRSSNESSEIIINSGTYNFTEKWADLQYKDKPVAVYASGAGKITINGGTFGMKGVFSEFLLNVLDSSRKADVRDNIEVRGGTYYNFNPANNRAEGPGTNFVADGYTVIQTKSGEDTIYTVVKAS